MKYLPMTNDQLKDVANSAGCKLTFDRVENEVIILDDKAEVIASADMYVAGILELKEDIFNPAYEELAQAMFDYAMTPLKHREDDYRCHWALVDSQGAATDIYLREDSLGVVSLGGYRPC